MRKTRIEHMFSGLPPIAEVPLLVNVSVSAKKCFCVRRLARRHRRELLQHADGAALFIRTTRSVGLTEEARCLGLSGNDRFWREADIRQSGEVRKVPTGDIQSSMRKVGFVPVPKVGT